jgi:hypothetical protein
MKRIELGADLTGLAKRPRSCAGAASMGSAKVEFTVIQIVIYWTQSELSEWLKRSSFARFDELASLSLSTYEVERVLLEARRSY